MWFRHFLLRKYENNRWIEHFQMSKNTFMDICNQVKPLISKHDNKYRKAIIVEICISCAIYELAHDANILTCSGLFAIGRSSITFVLHKMVMVINLVFSKLITWPVVIRCKL
jgi:hypothetical protein